MKNDEFWMREALAEAQKTLRASLNISSSKDSSAIEDVPIGAICVYENRIVGRGHNGRELFGDPTAHAETLALREAAHTLQTSHLKGVTLYVTLEPCPMCAGALWLARVERLVFGAWDAKAGACGSVFDVVRDPRLNHRIQVKGGVLEEECAEILRTFFEARRGKNRTGALNADKNDTNLVRNDTANSEASE